METPYDDEMVSPFDGGGIELFHPSDSCHIDEENGEENETENKKEMWMKNTVYTLHLIIWFVR